jgi:xylulose-5-phosphate/fructose-6-phosphate phosphoketolase
MRETAAALLSKMTQNLLTSDECARLYSYWSACNYLTLRMLYLRNNALLGEPLRKEDIKPRLLGHWGWLPGKAWSGAT